jgi:lipoprotein-anchoring transpeptidase ErfK/SrfK
MVAVVIALGATGVVSVAGHHPGDVARAMPAVTTAFADGEPVAALRAPGRIAPAAERAHHHHRAKPEPQLLVRIPHTMTARAHPDAGAHAVGTLVSSSKYYHVALTAWVEETAKRGRWGRVALPYTWPHRHGWIPLRGLHRSRTFVEVHVDLSQHRVRVTKFGKTLVAARAATGASASPTPAGRYFVTDRIPFGAGSALGSFAFGISGIQPHLPAGWSGGNQLAIHGTNDPSSIGRSASAGCVRVSERTLHHLLPLLRLGTPVIIQR